MEFDIREAKTDLSRLIERALAGDEVIIVEAGRRLVRLTPIEAVRPVLGSAKGQIVLKPGWDAPLTDGQIEDVFG